MKCWKFGREKTRSFIIIKLTCTFVCYSEFWRFFRYFYNLTGFLIICKIHFLSVLMKSILEFPVVQPACQNRQFPFLIKCYLYFTHSEKNDVEMPAA